MNKRKMIILYVLLLLVSIVIFSLAYVFNASGVLGFIITIFSIYLFIGCIIKLCRLSSKLKEGILGFIDLLFWLP